MRKFLLLFVLAIVFSSCVKRHKTLFQKVTQTQSKIDFNNRIVENDSLSILDNEFFYNGAGVALGDLNKDGLLDVFFTGNQVDNQLYLNRGKLSFQNVSAQAGIEKKDPLIWSSGVNIIDINADGLLDIYVCNTLRKEEHLRQNLLYINQGIDAQGVPHFKEQAQAYGLHDNSYSSHAQFFDFDQDGDLDVFIGVNRIENIDPNVFQNLQSESAVLSVDKLYENKGQTASGQLYFEDISRAANIRFHGFSHSTLVQDFNQDGWLDLYVANDYLSNDIVYLNQGDKTFTNEAGTLFKHFSLSSMGSDLGDVNNDGNLDLFVSEMQPYYNKRKKLFQKGTSYTKEILTRRYNYQYQYPRNVLQLHQGVNPNTQLPLFSEIGMQAGVAETDWSWASLFADFDNDGLEDLFVVNGFPKDIVDKDFSDFRVTANRLVSREQLLAVIPQIKMPNFVFKNRGSLQFDDVSIEWGTNFQTYTNGAVYGDLDNDGDLDLILNNINDPATVLENTLSQSEKVQHYIRFDLIGKDQNQAPYGAELRLYSGKSVQTKILLSGRGYLSQPESTLHFGLGAQTQIDSLWIQWPDGTKQRWLALEINQTHSLKYQKERLREFEEKPNNPLFKQANKALQIEHKDEDDDFIDFNLQITLPHKMSQYGPALVVGDLNADGLEDLIVGGSRGKKETLFFQQKNGTFRKETQSFKGQEKDLEEDAGMTLFDVDTDGDLDLYIAHGSGQFSPDSNYYDDVIWMNNGKGVFAKAPLDLPNFGANSSCVKPADFDHDGDLDLFVGNRVVPGQYPVSGRSFLLENKSSEKTLLFEDASNKLSTGQTPLGLVTDALWTDFNNDGWEDLIVVGEWMSVLFFENRQGQLKQIQQTGIENAKGWWNSISTADLDNDGDMDYILGNFGRNTYFKVQEDAPMGIIAKDFDANGSVDPFLSFYVRDSLGSKRNYLYHPWEDVIKQFRALRKTFNSFGAYGEAIVPEIFKEADLSGALFKNANWMETSWIENVGNNQFKLHKLPEEAQLAPVYGIHTFDINQDGYEDLLLVGNDFGVEVNQGRLDALQGLVLLNTQQKEFVPVAMENTHFIVPGDGKSLVQMAVGEQPYFVASQNNDSLKVYTPQLKKALKRLTWKANETYCLIELPEGKTQKRTKRNAFGFQSQSTFSFWISDKALNVTFFDAAQQPTRIIENQ